jgi:APA family basic amino acid/polyamine antiporter
MLRRVPDSDEPEGLRRVLGPFDATAVVIGAIVGVGIFFTPGRVAALAGDLALWTWALGGFIALLGALTFAEIGGMYPRTGAQYAALRDAYGPAVGFLYVVCNATAIQAGAIAIIAIIAVQNAATALTGGELSPFAAPFAAIGLTVLIAGANIRDVRAGAHIQNITTAAKLLALIAVVLVGVSFTGEPAPSRPVVTASPFVALATGLVPVLFAFGGWQQALWIGGEVRDPTRNVPRAIIGGVGVVVLIYLGTNWAYLHLLGVVLVDGIFFTLTAAASIVLLRRHPRATRPIRTPGFPVVPILFVLAEIGVIIGSWLQPNVRSAAIVGLVWIAAAYVLYRLRFRDRRE